MDQTEEMTKIIEKVAMMEGCMQTVHSRINTMQKDIEAIINDNKILHEMNKNIAVLATNYENQGKKIDVIETDVKELKAKPGKRWDSITLAVIISVISTAMGYMLGIVLK